MRAIIVVYPTPKNIKALIDLTDQDYIIGVDQAVQYLIDQHIHIDLAVGDFDSLKNHDLLRDLDVVRLDPIKDVTDTYQAINEAEKRGYKEMVMIGGFGGERMEHFIAHLTNFNRYPSLVMMNEYSKIYIKNEGEHTFTSPGYISFFGYPEAIISLEGFKYPLDAYQLRMFDPLGISNELTKTSGQLTVHQGKVLVVESNKK